MSSLVPLPDLYFDSFSYPVTPIISSAGGIVQFINLLFAELTTNFVWKATGLYECKIFTPYFFLTYCCFL